MPYNGCRADTYFGSLLVAVVSYNRDSAIVYLLMPSIYSRRILLCYIKCVIFIQQPMLDTETLHER